MSLDALRGFDMFWIIGGDALARALTVWMGTEAGHVLHKQFEHVAWEGFEVSPLGLVGIISKTRKQKSSAVRSTLLYSDFAIPERVEIGQEPVKHRFRDETGA